MNKKILYALFAMLFLALGLAGFLIYQKSLESLPANPSIDNLRQVTPAEIQQAQARLDNDQAAFVKAQTNNDLELCKTIVNSDVRSTCGSEILLNAALDSQKISDCEKINDLMFKVSCVENLAATGTISTCQTLNDSELKTVCLSSVYYKQAKAENKAETCNQISELIKRANCLSELKNIDLHSDADNDGFDFLQEIVNGTDPNNKDTDGDSYPDGYEFTNGFNPDGQGPLNVDMPDNISFCNSIQEAFLKTMCLKEFEGSPLDLFDCAKVVTKDLRDYCLKNPIR
ncbi:MAG TPA: hypothetical protein VFD16_01755 [Candidatus Saccharimonadales bacterium]|nr:hypothetical protein [Candidatus Saccharimonadales bacterium]